MCYFVSAPSGEPTKTAKRRKRPKRPGLLPRTAPMATAAGCNEWSPELIRKYQEQDPDIGDALSWVESGERPPWRSMRSKSPMLRSLWRQFESLVIRQNVLCRIFHSNSGAVKYYQTILPRVLRFTCLELVHGDAAAHLKLVKSLDQLQRRVWWLSWRRDMEIFIQNCSKCESYHRGRHFQGKSPKLQNNYAQTGVVQAKLNDSTYLVKTARGNKVFHTDKLKLIGPYCPPN